MTKRKPAKLTENERLHILLSIAERKVNRLKAENERLVQQHNSLIDQKLDAFVTAVPSEDYEKLKAENVRRVEQYHSIIDQHLAVIADLKAKNERLIKAGDTMARIICPPTHGGGEWDGEWDAWIDAKRPPTNPTK